MLRVLVVMMSSGEVTIDKSIESIGRQSRCDVELEIIRGLPEGEAHNRLYTLLNERGDEFDVLAKVDPDMVLGNPTFFSSVGGQFQMFPSLASLVVPVWDFLTHRNILGLHLWRRGVRFMTHDGGLWHDHVSISSHPRNRVLVSLSSQSPVTHFSEGSDAQIVRYVWRRLVKAAMARRSLSVFRAIPNIYRAEKIPFRSRAVHALSLGINPDYLESVTEAVLKGHAESALVAPLNPAIGLEEATRLVEALSATQERHIRQSLRQIAKSIEPDLPDRRTTRANFKRALVSKMMTPAVSQRLEASLASRDFR